jgi:HD-like signal output (HDOD) protein
MPQPCVQASAERQPKDVILSKIPAFPPVVLKALDLLASDRTEIAELARLITSDATLAAQVLRMANSALFGFTTAIDTVQHAVVTLGLARVQSLVMAVATTNYMRAAFRTEALTRCWRHTLASAIVAREMARATGQEPDRAYSLGLLHDIGRLGLLVAYPDAYNQLLAEASRDAVSLLDLEKRRFGMDHCEAGRLLMAEWGLPEAMSVAAGRHHDPPQGGPFDMLHVVYLACRMADTLGYFVVAPLQPARFEELTGMLPEEARERFPREDALKKSVELSVGEGQLGSKSSLPRPPEDPLELAVPEEEIAAEAAGGDFEDRWIAWGALVVIVAMATMLAVLMVLKYLGKVQ